MLPWMPAQVWPHQKESRCFESVGVLSYFSYSLPDRLPNPLLQQSALLLLNTFFTSLHRNVRSATDWERYEVNVGLSVAWMHVQICRKICGLGCVTRALVHAWFTQPSPRIFLHFWSGCLYCGVASVLPAQGEMLLWYSIGRIMCHCLTLTLSCAPLEPELLFTRPIIL